MQSLDEAQAYLEQVDTALGEHDLHMEGVLVGQVALWEYASEAGEDIVKRETDDVDIYTPDFETVFDLADAYNTVPKVTGARIEVNSVENAYMDLLVDHPLGEELYDFMQSDGGKRLDYDNMDLYVIPPTLYRQDKEKSMTNSSRRQKDENDLATLENLLVDAPELEETYT